MKKCFKVIIAIASIITAMATIGAVVAKFMQPKTIEISNENDCPDFFVKSCNGNVKIN